MIGSHVGFFIAFKQCYRSDSIAVVIFELCVRWCTPFHVLSGRMLKISKCWIGCTSQGPVLGSSFALLDDALSRYTLKLIIGIENRLSE